MHKKAIGIVEDDIQLREELESLLTATEDLELVFSVGSAEEAIAIIKSHRPQVILMDINLPGMSGVECVKVLKRKIPILEIIMLTVYQDEDNIFEALQAGANGYLIKSSEPEFVLQAVRDVSVGGAPITSHIARKVIHHFRQRNKRASGKDRALSPRETEVMLLMAQGFRYKEVADKLGIGLETVKTHVRHICEKMHVTNRIEAIVKYWS